MENKKHILKRVVACVLVVLMAVTAVPMSGFVGLELPKWSEMFATRASAFSENGYTYTVTDGKATITGCDDSVSGNVVIPDTLGGYPVTSIGVSAFEACTDLANITIQSGVTNIDRRAFFGCNGLISIVVPDSVTSIGESAFYNCKKLDNITIPDSIESIGNGSFNYTAWYDAQSSGDVYLGKYYYKYKGSMPKNTSVNIKPGTLGIADGAFESCSGLTSVTMPDTLIAIGNKTFRYCDNLMSINFSEQLKNIGDYAFQNCMSLTSVTFPINLTYIGCLAFGGCTGISKIYWNAENIRDFCDKNGFSYDVFSSIGKETSGVEVVFGDTVKSIPSYAFDCETYNSDIGKFVYTCGSIKSVKIGRNTTRIGNAAFKGCLSLTEITIPVSVTAIGDGVFEDCFGLTNINWNAKNVNDFEYSSHVFGNAGSESQGIDVV
ncbi:MAG: leucine-rich repeat domain-containing protein, partial [Acutalibacteraceae bacterium]